LTGGTSKRAKKDKSIEEDAESLVGYKVDAPDNEQEKTTLHDKEDVASAHVEKQSEIEVLYFPFAT
jgi:hypothetical protein